MYSVAGTINGFTFVSYGSDVLNMLLATLAIRFGMNITTMKY